MGTYREIPPRMTYRQALQHPVFAKEDLQPGNDDAVLPETLALTACAGIMGPSGDRERRQVAKKILNFFDVANRYWEGRAEAHAPELHILIDLYLHEEEGRGVAVSDACLAACVPCTSALRAIDRLVGSGMIERHSDRRDSRRKLLSLTDEARQSLAAFMDRFLPAAEVQAAPVGQSVAWISR